MFLEKQKIKIKKKFILLYTGYYRLFAIIIHYSFSNGCAHVCKKERGRERDRTRENVEKYWASIIPISRQH